MRKRLFLIPSLLAAGLFPQKAAAVTKPEVAPKDPRSTLFKLFTLRHKYTLAGHRSHSSHSSHSSHRSSSGGGYSTYSEPTYSPPPAPTYSTPDPDYTTPPPPASPLAVLPGNSEKFRRIVVQVQSALSVYGYYDGAIDGRVGPATRAALTKLQGDYNLKVTGTVTPETLDALHIAAD